MALTDRRAIDLPGSVGTSIIASPAYNHHHTSVDNLEMLDSSAGLLDPIESSEDVMDLELESDSEIESEVDRDSLELSPSSRSISPDSLMNLDTKSSFNNASTTDTSRGSTPPSSSKFGTGTEREEKETKKSKNNPRVPIATGISTTIPVTGEKPRPSQKDDPSLEDDVLYAIFLILYEKDPEGSGMTVKQICDILIDRHPEMANLSTKTSNLVSAKLNAYVKRVEKGDSSLKYALSRDWADASPKRMVYVYRGLLTDDFHIHIKSMMEKAPGASGAGAQNQNNHQTHQNHQNRGDGANHPQKSNNSNKDFGHLEIDDSFTAGKQASLKPRRSTMFDLGITRNSFLSNSIDKSNLFVPYSSAPVTASLKDKVTTEKLNNNMSNMTLEPKEPEEVAEPDAKEFEFEVFQEGEGDEGEDIIETFKKNGKRSKSMSYLNTKKHKILTAAAAAPRAPKTPCNHLPSPHAVAAAAALHAAAIKAINYDDLSDELLSGCNKWLDVIRSGFLSQDIGKPEGVSLADLDKYF